MSKNKSHNPSVASTIYSKDSGNTWSLSISIYKGTSAYSNLTVSNNNKKIYCLYEKDGYNEVVSARIDLSWLMD